MSFNFCTGRRYWNALKTQESLIKTCSREGLLILPDAKHPCPLHLPLYTQRREISPASCLSSQTRNAYVEVK